MGAQWIGRWAGGRIRDVKGEKVYVIERMRRVISLRVETETEAQAELALFLRAPENDQTRQEYAVERESSVLDAASLTEFLADAERRG